MLFNLYIEFVSDAQANLELILMQLYGPNSGALADKHNIHSIVPELDSAVEELDAAIHDLEQVEIELKEAIQQTVGNMSDLRYGRLSNGQLRNQIIEGLEAFRETCQPRK